MESVRVQIGKGEQQSMVNVEFEYPHSANESEQAQYQEKKFGCISKDIGTYESVEQAE